MVSLCGFYVFNPHVVLLPVFFFVLCCSIDPVSPCEVIKIVSNSRRLRPVEEGGTSPEARLPIAGTLHHLSATAHKAECFLSNLGLHRRHPDINLFCFCLQRYKIAR